MKPEFSRTAMVLEAVEMARWSRGTQLEGLVCHSDAGSLLTSVRYGERLAEIGARPSIGTVADSFDCDDRGAAGLGGLTLVTTDFVSWR